MLLKNYHEDKSGQVARVGRERGEVSLKPRGDFTAQWNPLGRRATKLIEKPR
jgi:hypothetical protein